MAGRADEAKQKKSPRLTVCLDSLNSIYTEEWVYAKATHVIGRDHYVVTPALSRHMPPAAATEPPAAAGTTSCITHLPVTGYRPRPSAAHFLEQTRRPRLWAKPHTREFDGLPTGYDKRG